MRNLLGVLALIVLFVGGVAGLVIYVRNDPHTPKPPKRTAADLPDFQGGVAEGVNVLRVFSQQTHDLQWEIRGIDRIELPKEGVIVFDGLQRATYFEGGKEKLRVSAKRLRLNPRTRNFEVLGDVTVTGYLHMTVTTDVVRWLAADAMLVAPGEVRAALKHLQFTTKRAEIRPRKNLLLCPNALRLVGHATLFEGRRLEADLVAQTATIGGPGLMRARVGEGKQPFAL